MFYSPYELDARLLNTAFHSFKTDTKLIIEIFASRPKWYLDLIDQEYKKLFKVTLRSDNMYTFLDKLISIGLPRVRDFRGVSPKGFDGRGNYTLGLKEQLIFSEIEFDNVVKVRGMDIVFVTTAKTNEEAEELLSLLGIPFRK